MTTYNSGYTYEELTNDNTDAYSFRTDDLSFLHCFKFR